MQVEQLKSFLPTIPQYMKQYIDGTIDLTVRSTVPCPLHNETHGRSFSYKEQDGIWRCFGACHTGGDIFDLHKTYHKMKSRDEAIKSLCNMYNLSYEPDMTFTHSKPDPDMKAAHNHRVYAAALQVARTVDDYVELDYIMSKVPVDTDELAEFCSRRGLPITNTETTEE